jgi:DNA-binding transcriptional ArsR family regulator
MKQITEINDPRLVKGLAHPLRVHILRILQSRIASPSEIAEEIDAPLGNVSYHVRFLARVGLIELASTKPRRGAVEHYYRAVGRVRITDEAWAQVPQVVKNSLISSTLDEVGRYIGAAAAVGGFDRHDANVSRRGIVVDEQGFSELAAAAKQLLDRAHEIEGDSAKRLAGTADHTEFEVNAGLVTMLFEAASLQEPPVVERKRRRRAAVRD